MAGSSQIGLGFCHGNASLRLVEWGDFVIDNRNFWGHLDLKRNNYEMTNHSCFISIYFVLKMPSSRSVSINDKTNTHTH
ncbi:MAG: hypothetical protein ACI9LX_003847 [Paraglaciecola sp.]|jgi:hypothetical protein